MIRSLLFRKLAPTKLAKAKKNMMPMLVNLAIDPGGQTDLTAQQPKKAKARQTLFERGNAPMQPPRWEDQRWNGGPERKAVEKKNGA